MSKKKKKSLKREKEKYCCISSNGSTISGYFKNFSVYELMEYLENFIPVETEEERRESIKEHYLPFLYSSLKNISYDEFVQIFPEAKEPRPSSAIK